MMLMKEEIPTKGNRSNTKATFGFSSVILLRNCVRTLMLFERIPKGIKLFMHKRKHYQALVNKSTDNSIFSVFTFLEHSKIIILRFHFLFISYVYMKHIQHEKFEKSDLMGCACMFTD